MTSCAKVLCTISRQSKIKIHSETGAKGIVGEPFHRNRLIPRDEMNLVTISQNKRKSAASAPINFISVEDGIARTQRVIDVILLIDGISGGAIPIIHISHAGGQDEIHKTADRHIIKRVGRQHIDAQIVRVLLPSACAV